MVYKIRKIYKMSKGVIYKKFIVNDHKRKIGLELLLKGYVDELRKMKNF